MDVTSDPGDALRLRIEFEENGGRHAIPVTIDEEAAGDGSARVRIDAHLGARVERAERRLTSPSDGE